MPSSATMNDDIVTADVVDVYHGTRVADPYRWLESLNSERTKQWVRAQNESTQRYLRRIPEREALRDRLMELRNYEQYTLPLRREGRMFFGKNDGLQNQKVMYVRPMEDPSDGVMTDADADVLIDPNAFSDEGTVALNTFEPSTSGSFVVYGVSEGGSDWQTLRVRDVETGEDLPERLEWNKFSGAAWVADDSGFYYGRYDEPDPDAVHQATTNGMRLYFHRLGTPQSDDRLVYERPDDPDLAFLPAVSEDGRYLVVKALRGSDRGNALYVKDLTAAPGEDRSTLQPLVNDFESRYSFIGNVGSTFYLLTDSDAPNERVVAVDLDRPDPSHWRTVLPESEAVLKSVNLVGDRLAVHALVDARSRLTIHTLDGQCVHTIDLPTIGSVLGTSGRQCDDGFYYTFASYTQPLTMYYHDLPSQETSVVHAPQLTDFDASAYTVRQIFYTSHDGTEIPMFVAHRTDLERHGANPTFMEGYGGFSMSMTPFFMSRTALWLEMGGVYAVPNVRGGGEYGEAWHRAGRRERKQNVFDDFAAAAHYLIDAGYTMPSKLAIGGVSNGGLLVGASITQRPHLFGAAVISVGVLDMLRYNKFTVGWAWESEYGSADDPEAFEYLYDYSPLHNVEPGTSYPATLLTTADTDDRVVPAHSYKFAATLQEAQGGDAPVLLRVDTDAGHGLSKPTGKEIDEAADVWAFLVKELDLRVPVDSDQERTRVTVPRR